MNRDHSVIFEIASKYWVYLVVSKLFHDLNGDRTLYCRMCWLSLCSFFFVFLSFMFFFSIPKVFICFLFKWKCHTFWLCWKELRLLWPLWAWVLKGFSWCSDDKESAHKAKTWVQSLDREDTPEEKMETHSSILAWRIPWAEEPGGLQSMGPQRVRHDWVTYTHTHLLVLRAGVTQELGTQGHGQGCLHCEAFLPCSCSSQEFLVFI